LRASKRKIIICLLIKHFVYSRDEPTENTTNDQPKVTLNDINQLKTRVKSIGITFNEMNAIQVNRYFFLNIIDNFIFLFFLGYIN